MWWLMLTVLNQWRLRQEDCQELKASLDYIAKFSVKTKQVNKKALMDY